MGQRKKPKKYNKMGYFQKQEYDDKLAKKYNINKDDYIEGNTSGGGRYDNLNEGQYKKAIKNAMRNDFDYRTSASHMDGVKGNASMGDFTKYERAAVKKHRQAGNGGEYSSNKDITGVTNNLVNDYRNDLQDQINAASQKREENKETFAPASQEPYEESESLTSAKERVQTWEKSNAGSDPSPFGPSGSKIDFGAGVFGNQSDASAQPSSEDKAQSQLDQFKNKLKDRENFQPVF